VNLQNKKWAHAVKLKSVLLKHKYRHSVQVSIKEKIITDAKETKKRNLILLDIQYPKRLRTVYLPHRLTEGI
jgi:hypothetical protein